MVQTVTEEHGLGGTIVAMEDPFEVGPGGSPRRIDSYLRFRRMVFIGSGGWRQIGATRTVPAQDATLELSRIFNLDRQEWRRMENFWVAITSLHDAVAAIVEPCSPLWGAHLFSTHLQLRGGALPAPDELRRRCVRYRSRELLEWLITVVPHMQRPTVIEENTML